MTSLDVIDEMEGMDFLKVAGGAAAGIGAIAALSIFGAFGSVTLLGATIGALLGGSAGLAVANTDQEERLSIKHTARAQEEGLWAESAQVRQSLANSATSMDGYLDVVKLMYGIAASCVEQDQENAQHSKEMLDSVRSYLDGLFAVWIPQAMKDDLQLMFDNRPTFYDMGLMIKESLRQGHIEMNSLVTSIEKMLVHLDAKGLISRGTINDEWQAFKVGLFAAADKNAVPNKKTGEAATTREKKS